MYLNTFINLEENINGYGQNQKSPSGHVIICMPGMVRVYLQNLRNLQDKEYICYGLSKKDNKAIRLGSINAPDENKMTNFKIDINNIQGKGVRADNIDCIAIVIEGDTVGNTDTVMVGYVNDKYLITPILEKGLPKKEVKSAQEERKDNTPSPKTTKVGAKEEQALETNVITPIQTEGPTPETKAEIAKEVAENQEALNTNVITPIQTEGPDPETKAEIAKEVAENQEALNTNVITPIQTEGPVPPTKAEIAEEVAENQEALNINVITPIQTEPYEPGKPNQPAAPGTGPAKLPTPGLKPGPVMPNQPAAPGTGPVKLPTPELKPEPGKPNQPAMPGPGPVILPTPELGKPSCSCGDDKKKGDKDLGKQIKNIIEALGRNETQVDNIEENIEYKLKELIAQGISREELLNRKDELEEQIKGLLDNKLVNKCEKDSTRNPMEEHSEEAMDLEDKFRTALNEQFGIGLDRGCKACQKPVEVIMDKDESFYEVNLDPEKQGISDGGTSKEEVDFLEQLETKLKGLQQLLKTTIGGEGSKSSIKDFSKINEVELIKEDNVQINKQKREKKNKIAEEKASYPNTKEEYSEKVEYERVREIFETSASIKPFENDSQPVDWVRISLAELISIPQLQYEWATQPFITFSYHKFNHLILGKDREVEQYYIGIPDVYHQTRGHILDIDKIERFVCRNADKLATGEPGYWIAMI